MKRQATLATSEGKQKDVIWVTRRGAAIACLAAVLCVAGGQMPITGAADNDFQFERSEVTIETDTRKHVFRVELALTAAQRAQGLQDRRFLPEDSGMLFIFEETAPIHMWMKNTLISLDMIFVDASGKIVSIAERTEPMSLDTVSSAGPAKGVLEVRAGTARRLGIAPGHRLLHARLDAAAKRPAPKR